MTNKYTGECVYCHNTVPAGTGIWNGSTSCADLVQVEDGYGLTETTCKNNEGAVKNYFMSKKYVALKEQIKAEHERMVAHWVAIGLHRTETKKQLKAEGKCDRCGGAGRSDNWIATGSVCYKCNGTGRTVN